MVPLVKSVIRASRWTVPCAAAGDAAAWKLTWRHLVWRLYGAALPQQNSIISSRAAKKQATTLPRCSLPLKRTIRGLAKCSQNAAKALAVALGNAISLLNPERIILGGRFVAAGDSLLNLLRQELPKYALPELVANVDVRLAELGEDSAFLGIAARVRSNLFAYPSMGGTVEHRPAKSRKKGKSS